MITSIENLVSNLEKNKKIIRYLKGAYKDKTGEDALLPDELIQNEKDYESNEIVPNAKFVSFKDKVISLNLPSATDKEAKAKIEKLRRAKDTSLLITKIDLSYFSDKNISVELMKRVIEGLKILKSVESINLSHNNLTDMYIDLIGEFLLIPNMSHINLSYNNFTKEGLKKLVQYIQSSKKLQSIDLSYNPFNKDLYSCFTLCGALKNCDKLKHFGLCDSTRDSGIRIMASIPTLESLNLEDSTYKKNSYDALSRFIGNKKYNLQNLSLKFCKIDFLYGAQFLSRGLKRNRTLRKLNLYGTMLSDVSGMIIINAVTEHKHLYELNLGFNQLSTFFCKAFGNVLKKNNVLNTVIISKNYNIINDNFAYILEGLVSNQKMFFLGDLLDTKIGVKYRESTEKLLLLNKQFGNWRETASLQTQKIDSFLSSVASSKQFSMIQTELLQQSKTNLNLNNTSNIISRSLMLSSRQNFNSDINDVIEPISPNRKSYNTFIASKSIEANTLNRSSSPSEKVIVPFSTQGTHFLRDSQNKVKKQNEKNKSKNKTRGSSFNRSSKGKKKDIPLNAKVNILNTTASFIQEVIDNDPSLLAENVKEKEEETKEAYEPIQFGYNKSYIDPAVKTKVDSIYDERDKLTIEKRKEDLIIQKYRIKDFTYDLDMEDQFIFNNYC